MAIKYGEMEEIIKLTREIKTFYEKNAPAHIKYGSFEKATEEQIKAFEEKLGERLPEDYRTFLLINDFEIGFDMNFNALDIEQVDRNWTMMKKHLDNGVFNDGRVEYHEKNNFGNWDGNYIKKVWWNPKWIPISYDSCGNMKCIDLDPGENGRKYQLIAMEIQDGQGPFVMGDAENFTAYLENHLKYLTEGKYTMDNFGDGSPMICVDSYS